MYKTKGDLFLSYLLQLLLVSFSVVVFVATAVVVSVLTAVVLSIAIDVGSI